MRANARIAGRAALALALLIVPFASVGGAAHDDRKASVTVRRIGPGAYYKKIVKPKKHWVIHVITVRLDAKSTVDVGLAGYELGHTEVLSALAPQYGAIAAINGDFGTRYKRPWNMYAQDGRLVQSERSWGRALSLSTDEKVGFLDHPQLRTKLVPVGGEAFKIGRVNNGKPGEHEVALFTRAAREVEHPPDGTCSARLLKKGGIKINQFGTASQRLIVDVVKCRYDRVNTQKGMVVSARREGSRKDDVKALLPGQKAKLTWTIGVKEGVDVIGGNPLIVENGRVLGEVVNDCGYLCRLHPRSAVGLTEDKLYMVVVDGRAEGVRGMYLNQLARFFVKKLEVDRAMTFDGGGAAEMWIKGEVVSTPSDGHERPVVNALLLLPGKDEEQPMPVGTSSTTSTYGQPSLAEFSTAERTLSQEAFESSAADGGSLGGLADYLERQGAPLPPWMEELANR